MSEAPLRSARNPCPQVQTELLEALSYLRALGATQGSLEQVERAAQEELAPHNDKRMGEWSELLEALPPLARSGEVLTRADLYRGLVSAEWSGRGEAEVEALLKRLKPWRKGPFQLGPTYIDTEWRSDWKWARVSPHVELRGRHVLDVGGGNGYYGWRMLEGGALSALVIDPTRQFHFQHLTVKRALSQLCEELGARRPLHLPLTLERFSLERPLFDVVFSMGVLYHRREPLEHLLRLKAHLKRGGQLILETLVHEGEGLLPIEGRYANMRNIWALPSVPLLCEWLKEAGFTSPRCVDLNRTSREEQRRTEWMSFYSLAEALHPEDELKTIEGHPAPLRATVICDQLDDK